MALESLPKIAPALFSAEQDLIQIYNKKTDTTGVINASLLGGSTPPSGVSGAIQFSNGSAFASDATNFFWDDTNNRLGVGTNTPTLPVDILGGVSNGGLKVRAGNTTSQNILDIANNGGTKGFYYRAGDNVLQYYGYDFSIESQSSNNNILLNAGSSSGEVRINGASGGRLSVKGSGSTSATTSLLVQNSAGTAAVTVKDDLSSTFGGTLNGTNLVMNANILFENILYGNNFFSQNTGATTIGAQAAADASAMLDIRSTTRGFLPPRMTTTQINAIASPANGLIAYNTTIDHLCVYQGGAWVKINHSPM
jgi:hypothetical protein